MNPGWSSLDDMRKEFLLVCLFLIFIEVMILMDVPTRVFTFVKPNEWKSVQKEVQMSPSMSMNPSPSETTTPSLPTPTSTPLSVMSPSPGPPKRILYLSQLWGAPPTDRRTGGNCVVESMWEKLGIDPSMDENYLKELLTNKDVYDAIVVHAIDFRFDEWTWLKQYEHESLRVLYTQEAQRTVTFMNDPEIMSVFHYISDFDITKPFAMQGFEMVSMDPNATISFEEREQGSMVQWTASNCCSTSNHRMEYVLELMQHIHVHSYGRCMHNHDFPASDMNTVNSEQAQEVWKRYKFVLAFENSCCEGYVSEKLSRALQLGVIPVILGTKNVEVYMPNNHSYLNARDYTPKQLAQRMKEIGSSKSLFEHYTNWRYGVDVHPRFIETFQNWRKQLLEMVCTHIEENRPLPSVIPLRHCSFYQTVPGQEDAMLMMHRKGVVLDEEGPWWPVDVEALAKAVNVTAPECG